MQAFTSSYGVSALGFSAGNSSLVYAAGGAAFTLFSFPASAIATKWLKRKSTQMLGILLYIPIALLVYLFANPITIWILMAFLGASWAMVMVTQEPMMLDSAPSDALLGTYSAILQVARTLGFELPDEQPDGPGLPPGLPRPPQRLAGRDEDSAAGVKE